MCVILYSIQLFSYSSHVIFRLDVSVCVDAIMSVLWVVGLVCMCYCVCLCPCVSKSACIHVLKIHIGVNLLVLYNYYISMTT